MQIQAAVNDLDDLILILMAGCNIITPCQLLVLVGAS